MIIETPRLLLRPVAPADVDALPRLFNDPGVGEYLLDPGPWGRGLATEAAAAVLRFGFESATLLEVFAGADVPNETSFRVMDRLGMSPAFETGPEERRRVRYYSRKR